MATTTQNLGLIKPAGTDKIRIAQINSNMDTLDTKIGPVGSTPLQTQAANAAASISALQKGLAIVCNGNTHAAIPSGSYAYVRNHSSLAEGLYQATAAIAANDTLSASNLTAVPGGGLNSLLNSLNSNMTDIGNKLLPAFYNADTDRNTDANRTTAMEFLLTNYFRYGYHFAIVRYASGFYNGYIYVGGYNNIVNIFIEIPQGVDGKLVVWRRFENGTYSKAVVS